jgi:UDP-glucuronate 4-epimerase
LNKALIKKNHSTVRLDEINDYYDVNLKFARLAELGIKSDEAEPFMNLVSGKKTVHLFNLLK